MAKMSKEEEIIEALKPYEVRDNTVSALALLIQSPNVDESKVIATMMALTNIPPNDNAAIKKFGNKLMALVPLGSLSASANTDRLKECLKAIGATTSSGSKKAQGLLDEISQEKWFEWKPNENESLHSTRKLRRNRLKEDKDGYIEYFQGLLDAANLQMMAVDGNEYFSQAHPLLSDTTKLKTSIKSIPDIIIIEKTNKPLTIDIILDNLIAFIEIKHKEKQFRDSESKFHVLACGSIKAKRGLSSDLLCFQTNLAGRTKFYAFQKSDKGTELNSYLINIATMISLLGKMPTNKTNIPDLTNPLEVQTL